MLLNILFNVFYERREQSNYRIFIKSNGIESIDVFFLNFAVLKLSSQRYLYVSSEDSIWLSNQKIDISKLKRSISSGDKINSEWIAIKQKLIQKGRPNVSLDTFGDHYQLYLGLIVNKYIANVKNIPFIRNIDTLLVSDNWSHLISKAQKNLTILKNNGYLMATFTFENCQIDTIMRCDIRYDTVKRYLSGQVYYDMESEKRNLNLISKTIQFKPPVFFSRKAMIDLENRIQNSKIYELSKPLDIVVKDSLVSMIARLKNRKINKFNAFIGLLPNSYNSDKLQITADVNFELYNLFEKGIQVMLKWQKPQNGNQFFSIQNQVPFLFNTNFGTHIMLNIEKFDSTFLRTQYELGLLYQADVYSSIRLMYIGQGSNVLKQDTTFLTKGTLPSFFDYGYQKFGIGLLHQKLDDIMMPHSGTRVDVQVDLGLKKININKNFAERTVSGLKKTYGELFDSIGVKKTILYLHSNIEKYTALSSNLTIKTSFQARVLVSQNIAQNEKFTFGGYKMPRGFDDHFFQSPYYSVLSVESHFFISQYSRLALAYDHSLMQDPSRSDFAIIQPKGVSVGFSLYRNGGMFNFWYSIGHLAPQKIRFDHSKIHLGYVALF